MVRLTKKIAFCKSFPLQFLLSLYQDVFEVVNPLGSGKKKQKLLAMYMTLSEILPHNRSSIDPMQLVMLCRETDYQFFGQEKVFCSLVKDFKVIPDCSMPFETGQTVKGVVIAIAGHNLRSHSLGGFTENFSKSKNFCRYCIIARDKFENEPTKLGPTRTVESYKNRVAKLSMGSKNCVDGAKKDSLQIIFKSLQLFYVCLPGLPPCLGHDLFEGIVSVDLQLYLKHLVAIGKHFTFVQINRMVSQIKFKGSYADNQSCVIRADGEKLGGSAAQNWCLLRLLPILVGKHIKNPLEDQIWQLCLKLAEILEHVCAPTIHTNQVAYLKLLAEYLESRAAIFSDRPLKQKHHFLLHYPDLIIKFSLPFASGLWKVSTHILSSVPEAPQFQEPM